MRGDGATRLYTRRRSELYWKTGLQLYTTDNPPGPLEWTLDGSGNVILGQPPEPGDSLVAYGIPAQKERTMRWRWHLLCLLAAPTLYFPWVTTWPRDPHVLADDNDVRIVNAMRADPWSVLHCRRKDGLYDVPAWAFSYVSSNFMEAARYAAAFEGCLSVWATYVLGLVLGGPAVALVAALGVTINWWHASIARWQMWLSAPAMAALAGAVSVSAIMRESRWRCLAAGTLIAAACWVHLPGTVIALVLPLWWTWHAIITPNFCRRTKFLATTIALTTTLFVAGFSPGMPAYTPPRDRTFSGRFGQIMFRRGGEAGPREFPDFWVQLKRQAHVVTGGADLGVDADTNFALLNPIEVVAALIGFLLAVPRFTEPKRTLPVIWIGVTMLASLCATEADKGRRLQVAEPAMFLLAASALVETTRWAWQRSSAARRRVLALGLVTLAATNAAVNVSGLWRFLNTRTQDDASVHRPWSE